MKLGQILHTAPLSDKLGLPSSICFPLHTHAYLFSFKRIKFCCGSPAAFYFTPSPKRNSHIFSIHLPVPPPPPVCACSGGELHRVVLGWTRPLLPYPPLSPRSAARQGCQSQHHSVGGVLAEGPSGAQLLSQRLRHVLRLLPCRPERYFY